MLSSRGLSERRWAGFARQVRTAGLRHCEACAGCRRRPVAATLQFLCVHDKDLTAPLLGVPQASPNAIEQARTSSDGYDPQSSTAPELVGGKVSVAQTVSTAALLQSDVRIVYIEHDRALRRVVGKSLIASGYRVRTAADGRSGLHMSSWFRIGWSLTYGSPTWTA